MLVHKRTMGVLDLIAVEVSKPLPGGDTIRLLSATMQSLDGLDPAEWWEIRRDSPLGRKCRVYYPLMEPILDESGALIDVRPIQADELDAGDDPIPLQRPPSIRRRPKNLMPFLKR